MLSEKSRPVIEATAEVVAAHMDEITPKFYAHMFEAHPELLNGVFSRANQRNGEQPKALSGSIVRFAVHLLEHPDSLPEAVLSRIAHKHTSLGITEDQLLRGRTLMTMPRRAQRMCSVEGASVG